MLRGTEMPACPYRPKVNNLAPRDVRWTASKSNTQTPPVSAAVRVMSLIPRHHPCMHPASTMHRICRLGDVEVVLCSRTGSSNTDVRQITVVARRSPACLLQCSLQPAHF